ncbi:hypothetical protein [Microbacterium sp. bgisy189]|uniref:hypothetical protein n=1 Tax=Microbacterium sp. bgisy189 TaxID=3413798 RepID=UPI003EBCACCD
MGNARDELREVAAARTARSGLERQLQAMLARRGETRQRVSGAEAALAAEARDVAKLESFSLTKVWASLRGTDLDDLQRERAEVQAAQYALAEARQMLADHDASVADLEGRLAAFGDLDARHSRALAAREHEMRAGDGAAEALDQVAERRGALHAEVVELQQAIEASVHADAALAAAEECLDSASGWATYDTFFGGGMIADLVKHDRMNKAADLIRRADRALAELGAELADVGMAAAGDLGIDDFSRALDIWFDNIFTDWAVRDRVVAAAQRVQQLRAGIAGIHTDLTARLIAARARDADLVAEHERLLAAD